MPRTNSNTSTVSVSSRKSVNPATAVTAAMMYAQRKPPKRTEERAKKNATAESVMNA